MSPQHLTSLWPTMITELVSCSQHSWFGRLVKIWDTTSFPFNIFKKISSRYCACKNIVDTNWKLTYFCSSDVYFLQPNRIPVGLCYLSCSGVSWMKFLFALIVPYWLLLQFLPTYVYPLHHSCSCSAQCSLFLLSCSFSLLPPAMRMRSHIKKESESMLYWQFMVIQATLWLKFCKWIYTRLDSAFFLLVFYSA